MNAERLALIAQQLAELALEAAQGEAAPLPSGLVDAAGAALLLAISEGKVRELTRQGRLPAIQLDRLVRYDPAEVLAWAREQRDG